MSCTGHKSQCTVYNIDKCINIALGGINGVHRYPVGQASGPASDARTLCVSVCGRGGGGTVECV